MAGLLGIYLLLFLLRRCAFAFDISGFLVLIFSGFFVSKGLQDWLGMNDI